MFSNGVQILLLHPSNTLTSAHPPTDSHPPQHLRLTHVHLALADHAHPVVLSEPALHRHALVLHECRRVKSVGASLLLTG